MHIYARATAKGKRVQVDALSLSFLLSIAQLFLSTHANDQSCKRNKILFCSLIWGPKITRLSCRMQVLMQL
jgi:hypothetical protein